MIKLLLKSPRGQPVICLFFIVFVSLCSYSIGETYSYLQSNREYKADLKAAKVFFLNIQLGNVPEDGKEGIKADNNKHVLDLGVIASGSQKELKKLLIFENVTEATLAVSWSLDDDISEFFLKSQGRILLLSYADQHKNESASKQAYSSSEKEILEEAQKTLYLFSDYVIQENISTTRSVYQQAYFLGNEMQNQSLNLISVSEKNYSSDVLLTNQELQTFANPFPFDLKLNIPQKTKPGLYSGFLVIKAKENYIVDRILIRFVVIEKNTERVFFKTYISEENIINQSDKESITEKVYEEENEGTKGALTNNTDSSTQEEELSVKPLPENQTSATENNIEEEIHDDALLPEENIEVKKENDSLPTDEDESKILNSDKTQLKANQDATVSP